MKSKIFFFLTILAIIISCKKPEEVISGNGTTGGNGSGGGGGNTNTNRPPIANAGSDQTITFPGSNLTIDGSGSTDPDNDIMSFLWTKISGPSSFTITDSNAVQTQVLNLVQGTYRFELKVTDSVGLSALDTMQIIVNSSLPNRPPVANAGTDQSVTIQSPSNLTVFLNGSQSYDSSGISIQFLWRQIAGPSNCQLGQPWLATPMIYSPNIPGVYSFELKVWNSNGEDLDTTNITVSIPYHCGPNRSEVPATLTFLSDLPGQIQSPEIISAGNKLIVPAWFNNATAIISNNIYVYDRVTQNWTTIQASLPRIAATTIAAGNKVFFAGGSYLFNGDFANTSVVDIYDVTTNTWTVTNLSEAREGCAAVVSGNKVFFAGGLKNQIEFSNRVDIYDLETNSWTSSNLPGGARVVSAAVNVMNKVLFCGGLTEVIGTIGGMDLTGPTPTIDIYDNNTGQWSAGTMQVNKSRFAAVCVNEKVYLAGGIPENNWATFHVEELQVNTMNSSSSCLHQPMGSGRGAITNDKIIFFAQPMFAGTAINRFDILNTLTSEWSVGVLPAEIANNNNSRAIVSVNNEVYTIIGTKLYKMNL